MKGYRLSCRLLCAGLALASAATGEPLLWCAKEQYPTVQLVVGQNAPPQEQLAAQEFQRYWKMTTGYDVPQALAPGTDHPVWLGRTAITAEDWAALNDAVEVAALGPHGITLYAPPVEEAHPLFIVGGSPIGTLYAVYEFFERYMGVRWLAPGVTHIPDAPPDSIADVRVRYQPPFLYRTSSYYGNWPNKDEYLRANRISEEPGFGLFVHTFYPLLLPEKYFPEHPEYYSEINGKRVAPVGYDWQNETERADHPNTLAQLCMGNPDVADAILSELLTRVRANPEPKIWSVSQNDWDSYCTCPICKAIDEREGTPMGSLLTGVNRIADGLRTTFPDHYVETLAYTYSRKAPKTLRPRDNVIIRLCSIECDFAAPLDSPSSPVNRAFAEDIRAWSRIAGALYIWDYTPSYYNYHAPHPNFHVLQPNLRFFAEHNVKGMFEQGAESLGAEFCYLRGYLLAKLMWDPYADAQSIMDEFIRLYYREAAPCIKEYIDFITHKVLDTHAFMGCFDRALWMDYDAVKTAQDIFAKAFAAVQSGEVRRRVDEAYLPVQWASLACSPKVEYKDGALNARWPEGPTLEEYLQRAQSFGFNHKESLQNTLDIAKARPASRELSTPVETLENDRYEVWVTPRLTGAVIRWRDKQLGVELLTGYERYWNSPGKWEDWISTPFKVERPVADAYDVLERTADSLTIQAATEEGLVVRRTMRLDGDRIRVTLETENPTDKAISGVVKIHPEFCAQAPVVPEIWLETAEGWTQPQTALPVHGLAYGEYLEPERYRRMAFHAPGKPLTVVCEFDPAELSGLLYFYNAEQTAQQVNLELIPKRAPLNPGERRAIHGTYYATPLRPDAL